MIFQVNSGVKAMVRASQIYICTPTTSNSCHSLVSFVNESSLTNIDDLLISQFPKTNVHKAQAHSQLSEFVSKFAVLRNE